MRPHRDPPRESGLGRTQVDIIAGSADLSSEEIFKQSFLAFLRSRFNNDANLIAYTFSITERAAENWINGVSLPNAYRLWLILRTEPDAAGFLHLAIDNPPRLPVPATQALRRAV